MEQNTGAKHTSRNRKSVFWNRFEYGALSRKVRATGHGLTFHEDTFLEQGYTLRVCKGLSIRYSSYPVRPYRLFMYTYLLTIV
jgi:hypothetical protein